MSKDEVKDEVKKIDDGGPVHPDWPPPDPVTDELVQRPGMSVRMWLAGQNMAAFLVTPAPASGGVPSRLEFTSDLASLALEYADTLIRESKR